MAHYRQDPQGVSHQRASLNQRRSLQCRRNPLEDAQRARDQRLEVLGVQGKGEQRGADGEAEQALRAEGPAEGILGHEQMMAGPGALVIWAQIWTTRRLRHRGGNSALSRFRSRRLSYQSQPPSCFPIWIPSI